jgi:Papain family cysteine protease
MKSALLPLLAVGLLAHASLGQNYSTGCLFDSAKYESVPLSAPLSRGDYRVPSQASLRKYCPTPQDQGATGTCTAWAAAYAGRTILMAQRRNVSGQMAVDLGRFSPSFVYNQIRQTPDCRYGTYIVDAMHVLKTQGAPLFNDFGFQCERSVNPGDRLKARDHLIMDYKRLFLYQGGAKSAVLPGVKKSLAEGKPVIISIQCFKSWDNVRDVWNPPAGYSDASKGYHAVTVVGYDDQKYGGAVEIMNSWGPKWANKGFFWMRYKDFETHCVEAFEMTDFAASAPGGLGGQVKKANPNPEEYTPPVSTKSFKGEVALRKLDTKPLEVVLDRGIYRSRAALTPGTVLQLLLSHQEPVYLYVLNLDEAQRGKLLFPQPGYSPLLSYRRGVVPFPSEDQYLQLDAARGSDHLIMLYSRKALDIKQLIAKISAGSGSVSERLKQALGRDLIAPASIQYTNNAPGFTLRDGGGTGSVVPVVIELRK